MLLAGIGISCGGGSVRDPAIATMGAAATSAPAAGGAARANTKNKLGTVVMVSPSHVLPDLSGDRGITQSEDGHRRVLVDRMRIIARDDGTMERAAELLPIGPITATKLPTRLGGGYLFHSTSGGGTQLWRSASWLGKLDPLVQFSSVASEVVPGFDRLYVRLTTQNRLIALDAQSGKQLPLAPLPAAAAYGPLAFADGWRAVVDSDLRGPLVTFDAGMTWRAIGITERVTSIPILSGNPTLRVADGQYTVDARGAVTYQPDAHDSEATDEEGEETPVRPAGPLGRKPLRAAVEDGWPDTPTTAVVARGGALVRVSLSDGAIRDTAENAYPERLASCHAVRLGPDAGAAARSAPGGTDKQGATPEPASAVGASSGIGFICGERDGPTTIYAFKPPLAMQPVMRFARPRFVAASGNGALVIRGTCSDAATPLGDTRAYCVRTVLGSTREIRVKGDLGAERVVALADERVAVIVPPRPGAAGQLTLLSPKGTGMSNVPLALPTEPRSVAREVRRGMWLEGFEEREPGVLGGWVEAGGPVVGVRVALTGKVTAGDLRDDAGGVILAGRFALSRGDGGRAAESSDGGMTWTVFDLPDSDEDPVKEPSRACSPVGCALHGWIRVGWGKTEVPSDLSPAEPPPALYVPLKTAEGFSLQCSEVAQVTPPLPPERPKPPPPRVVMPLHGPRGPAGPQPTAWLPFRNTAPPTLSSEEIGFDNGGPYDVVSLRAYAWGRKGADWSRVGRWMIRFDDRFDPAGGVRSSAVSASPWIDEASAADAIGTGSYGYSSSWGAFLDPSGKGALAQACRGQACSLFAVGQGQPILPIRDLAGRSGSFFRPFPHGAVRVGETWFYIAPTQALDGVTLSRIDLGVARSLATFFRPGQSRSYAPADPPRLIRRALGGGLGVLVAGTPDPGARSGGWLVYPVDPDTGAIGDAIALGRKDLAGASLERCSAGQDGWQFDTALESSPGIRFGGGHAALDNVEFRLRMDPGFVCVDGVSARMDGTFTKPTNKPGAAGKPTKPAPSASEDPEALSFPLAATERGSGKRWVFRCSKVRGG